MSSSGVFCIYNPHSRRILFLLNLSSSIRFLNMPKPSKRSFLKSYLRLHRIALFTYIYHIYATGISFLHYSLLSTFIHQFCNLIGFFHSCFTKKKWLMSKLHRFIYNTISNNASIHMFIRYVFTELVPNYFFHILCLYQLNIFHMISIWLPWPVGSFSIEHVIFVKDMPF